MPTKTKIAFLSPATLPQSPLQARYDVLCAAYARVDSLDPELGQAVREWLDYGRRYVQTRPEVGMVGTFLQYTDSIAVEVVRVSPNGRTIWTRDMHAIRTDDNGMSESQTYRYEPNPTGTVRRFSYRDSGRKWKMAGVPVTERGCVVSLGTARAYHDFSF